MTALQVFSILAVSYFSLASGEFLDGQLDAVIPDTCEPVITVVGHHFVPRDDCVRDDEIKKIRAQQIKEKYINRLITYRERPESEAVEDMINTLVDADAFHFSTNELKCTACSTGFQLMKDLYNNNYTTEDIMRIVTDLCIDLNFMYPEMCKKIVGLYGYAVAEIMNTTSHDSLSFCANLFNGICYPEHVDKFIWNVTLPEKPKPPIKALKENPEPVRKLKVLHIADTHWDMEYMEGSPSICGGFLCCRKDSPPIRNRTEKAGKWGGWMCDIPEITFDEVIRKIKDTYPDIDYVIWTGDIPAHDMWNQTVESNYKVLDESVKKLKKAFPNIPIYPALGNHESIPPNLYPQKNQTTDNPLLWLYSKLNEEWHQWLPGKHSDTIMRGAFYSVLIRPKLRLISLNTNYCYIMNWWLLADAVDPEEELKWLVEELVKAEENGEKVHIIGHIPPGYTDCNKGWQTNFYKIINRFESTITAQFYGHTHYDEFEVFYDMNDNKRPFGVAYVAPSVTTYTYLNVGFRVYHVDGDYENSTRYVLDHDTWIMDLDYSNKVGSSVWQKSYSARDTFGMKSLFPADWHSIYENMIKNDTLVQIYNLYRWKESVMTPYCNENCKMNILCDIRSCVQYGKPNLPSLW